MKRLLLATLMLSSPLVQASFHNMKVVEVFPGTAAAPNAQYVVLQMWTAGQNSVGGHMVTVYNSTGVLLGTGTFTFAGGVGNGSNQDKILIATAQAATFFNLSADLVMPSAVIPLSGGKVCFDASPIDCVSWGDYSGSNAGVGAPLNPVSAPIVGDGGLIPGRAAQRRLDIVLPDTTLASGDDTDDSANDFKLVDPAPKNNARVTGTIPPNTCGNGALEGLEQCDDNNTDDGDACSADCSEVTTKIFLDGFE
jgi:cysteine-rich repeat protein